MVAHTAVPRVPASDVLFISLAPGSARSLGLMLMTLSYETVVTQSRIEAVQSYGDFCGACLC